MPGRRTSAAYCQVPATILGISTIFCGVPSSLNCAGVFCGAVGEIVRLNFCPPISSP
jgi:hypothetical protein